MVGLHTHLAPTEFWNTPNLCNATIIEVPHPGASFKRYKEPWWPDGTRLYRHFPSGRLKVFFETTKARNLWIHKLSDRNPSLLALKSSNPIERFLELFMVLSITEEKNKRD